MRKVIFLAVFFFAATLSSHSQGHSNTGSTYKTALGIKFWPGGITIKHFIRENRALEGIGYFWAHGFRFTALYEIHGDFNGAEGLKWYVGPGAHIGAYNEAWYHGNHYYTSGAVSLGIDGVLGLDYKFSGAPINLSLDFQPSLEILSNPYFTGWGGLAIRYTF